MGAKTLLRYHIVLVTKYRKRALSGVEDEVLRVFEEVAGASGFFIERLAVEDGDHVHLVVRLPPKYSVESVVARVKAMTTQRLWASSEEHLRRFYWGSKRKFWSGGYYAATVGDVSGEQVERYLRKQGHWK